MEEIMRILPVHEMIKKRNAILDMCATIQQLKKAIDTEGALLSPYLESASYSIERDHYYEKSVKKHVDHYTWLALVDQNKITNAMTDKAKNAFRETLCENPPEFCEKEIAAFAQNATRLYVESATQTFRDVFKEFTGCNYGDWHNPKKSNINFIASTFRANVGARPGYSGGMELSHYNRSLQDLLTAAHLADPDERTTDTIEQIMRSAKDHDKQTCTFRTAYFCFTLFRNGNALIKWNAEKQHILDQINRFGSTGELPDTLNRKYKPEHWKEAA